MLLVGCWLLVAAGGGAATVNQLAVVPPGDQPRALGWVSSLLLLVDVVFAATAAASIYVVRNASGGCEDDIGSLRCVGANRLDAPRRGPACACAASCVPLSSPDPSTPFPSGHGTAMYLGCQNMALLTFTVARMLLPRSPKLHDVSDFGENAIPSNESGGMLRAKQRALYRRLSSDGLTRARRRSHLAPSSFGCFSDIGRHILDGASA